jgi:hypothetical protein
MIRRRLLTALAGVALMGSVGCSRDDRTYPAEFQVLSQKQPATGATVVLHPVGNADPAAPRPTGKVDEAGVVKLSTFGENDGAPPGDYVVTVVWYDVTSTPEQAVAIKGGDKLKGKYRRPDGPAAPRVTIQKQPNQLPPLEL